jgi:hypothetical protein
LITGRHRAAGGALIAFWEFRDGIAGPVIPVAALADQLPRYGNPSGPYRLSADIAGPLTLAFPCGLVAGTSAASRTAKLCGHGPGFIHSTSRAAGDN